MTFNRRNDRDRAERESEFEEKMISINRTAKTYQGGRRFRFAALVVIGDRNGRVGMGIGKAKEVPVAIEKAKSVARKNLIQVPVQNGTIPHDIVGESTRSRVLLKPAGPGTGVIAGTVPRSIAELAGITNLLSKELGSRNQINVAYAVFDGLKNLRTPAQVKALRDGAA
ncbi:30S ribosomal protein S5 [Deinococcus peraridilitoris]|uniref:Small ribosomal subunit protein uS5 n=1 Tax=Deinococcus peraridilitoris (strain DSM 19664 / LMG 22246 / CIP 109416 / KR-200) TaxID=937777 RepID=L0A3M6_DEIPD|nr:30S ribosomal protein S5 [Deinococcus peraridilitoris]AFZ68503.1 ribosomal protein S5, bacterial/organelle type [Deinococcus peraridilitoris DSM 19664]